MKLDTKQFKRFKELEKLIKAKKASSADEKEFADLLAIKNDKGSNAIEWWKNYPALLKDVTNIAFNWIPGTRVPYGSDELKLGLVAVAKLAPGIGRSTTSADAFNSQIRQLWLDLHRKYRGIGTYQQSDLAMAVIAINSAFEALAKFERIYGVINTYHVGNRVVPYGLKEAFGIDNSLEENLADFRYTLNLYIEKMRQLCLPRGLSILESDLISLSNVYKDSNNRRAFLFAFDTEVFGIYDPTTVSTGGCVKFKTYESEMNGSTPNGADAFLLSDITNIMDTILSALLTDDDIARICSDLLAAYGPENVMTMSSVPSDYRVEPVHDYERLVQFHNLSIVGWCSSIFEDSIINTVQADAFRTGQCPFVIYQQNDTVMYQVGMGRSNYVKVGNLNHPTYNSATGTQCGPEGRVILDTFVENPGEVEVMCGTRYTTIVNAQTLVTTNTYRREVDIFGSKIVEAVYLWSYDGQFYNTSLFNGTIVEENTFTSKIYDYLHLSQMDWYPTFMVIDSGDYELFGDVDNFAIVERSTLLRLHEVALLSGYKIPMVSSTD